MNIEQFLSEHRVDFKRHGEHHHATSGFVQVDCPYCSPDSKRYRLGLSGNRASCWTCGPHYFYPTLQAVTGANQQNLDDYKRDADPLPTREKVKGKLIVPYGVGVLKYAHKKYLRSRHFDWRDIKHRFGVKGIGLSPRLPWRLWIPISFDHRVVTWTTRTIDDTVEPRYISAFPHEGEIDIKQILYGEDECYTGILVTEGPINVWRVGKGTGATFGTKYSTAQVARIARYAKIFICFDATPEAQRQAQKLCGDLAALTDNPVHNIVLDSGKDPAEASDKEVQLLRRLVK